MTTIPEYSLLSTDGGFRTCISGFQFGNMRQVIGISNEKSEEAFNDKTERQTYRRSRSGYGMFMKKPDVVINPVKKIIDAIQIKIVGVSS